MNKQIKLSFALCIILSAIYSCGSSAPTLPPPTPGAAPKSSAPVAVAKPIAPVVEDKKNPLDDLKTSHTDEFYNASGKRDPFKTFEGGSIIYNAITKAPLEQFEINQLQLTGIIWGIARPKVLFQAPDGYSYIAQIGSGIGRNRGKITKITKNRVLIGEEFRDPTGQYVARESEFTIADDQAKDTNFNELEVKYSDE